MQCRERPLSSQYSIAPWASRALSIGCTLLFTVALVLWNMAPSGACLKRRPSSQWVSVRCTSHLNHRILDVFMNKQTVISIMVDIVIQGVFLVFLFQHRAPYDKQRYKKTEKALFCYLAYKQLTSKVTAGCNSSTTKVALLLPVKCAVPSVHTVCLSRSIFASHVTHSPITLQYFCLPFTDDITERSTAGRI